MTPVRAGDGDDQRESVKPFRPENLIYRTCYAPVDLREMLGSAETRSKIRRLPGPQLYFGLQELSDDETTALLPHITEEQWTAVLDLDLWSRDRVQLSAFAGRHRFLMMTSDPVARKLLRGVDRSLWQLLYRRRLKVHRREEEEFEGEPAADDEWFTTPDGDFLIVLPDHPELAGLLRSLLLRLYQLEPEATRFDLLSSLARTSAELEEEAYQERKLRIEDLGFQDYFDALSVYTYLESGEKLPEKDWGGELREVTVLPVRQQSGGETRFFLFQAIDGLTDPIDRERLMEEIAFVTNKVLSADRVSPASPGRVKRGIRKALCGINLGLDVWSQGRLNVAQEALRRHYLQTFFQYGYSRLMDLQKQARAGATVGRPDPGSFPEAFLEGLLKPFPLRTVRTPKGWRRRFLETRRHLEICRRKLDRMTLA